MHIQYTYGSMHTTRLVLLASMIVVLEYAYSSWISYS